MAAVAPHKCADWCPLYGRSHRYSDWGTWSDNRHPKCDCGYEDVTRELPPMPVPKGR